MVHDDDDDNDDGGTNKLTLLRSSVDPKLLGVLGMANKHELVYETSTECSESCISFQWIISLKTKV